MYQPMTFEEFKTKKLNEEINSTLAVALSDVPMGTYRRDQLPQITNYEGFLKDLTDNQISMKQIKIKPSEYKPTQAEFNDEKVMSLVKSYKSGNTPKPVIVSNDGYILDGHHRWKAVYALGYDMDANQVDMGIDEMIAHMKDKDYVMNKKINESTEII